MMPYGGFIPQLKMFSMFLYVLPPPPPPQVSTGPLDDPLLSQAVNRAAEQAVERGPASPPPLGPASPPPLGREDTDCTVWLAMQLVDINRSDRGIACMIVKKISCYLKFVDLTINFHFGCLIKLRIGRQHLYTYFPLSRLSPAMHGHAVS